MVTVIIIISLVWYIIPLHVISYCCRLYTTSVDDDDGLITH